MSIIATRTLEFEHPEVRRQRQIKELWTADPKADQKRWSRRAELAEELETAEYERSEMLQAIAAEHQRLKDDAAEALELLAKVRRLEEFEASLTSRMEAADAKPGQVRMKLAEAAPLHLERLVSELDAEHRRVRLLSSHPGTNWQGRTEYLQRLTALLRAAMDAREDPELTPEAIREMFTEFHQLQLESSLDGSE